jgi:hypothetical protein
MNSEESPPAAPGPAPAAGMRADLHNPSVDEPAAEAGLCGNVHMPSGRICVLPTKHAGSCRFVPRGQAASPGS